MTTMNIQPLVSIIVPVYGVEKHISQCARSLFAQTYANIEIIFVDDCSNDNSITNLYATIEEYPHIKSKLRIIRLEQNLGSAVARLIGLKAATGDYVIQFDSDDYVELNIIEALVSTAIRNNSDITICDFDLVYPNNSIPVKVNPSLNKEELIGQLFTGKVHGSFWNKLIKRDLYTKNGIELTVGLNMCEDLSVMYKLVYFSNSISYLPAVLYHYRQLVASSFSANKMSMAQQSNRIQLLEQICTFSKEETGNDEKFEQYKRYIIASNKAEILLYGNYKKATAFKRPEMRISLDDINKHPNLHRNFRIILRLDKYKLYPFMHIMRLLQKMYSFLKK